MLDKPASTDAASDLLVRRGEEDHVALERYAGALEREQRHELRDRLALHVERAAAPDVPVLHDARERGDRPVLRARKHDVHMVEQDEGPGARSEEHTSELQSQSNLVCRLLLEKKNLADTRFRQRFLDADFIRFADRAALR